jgi:hypothetical protein
MMFCRRPVALAGAAGAALILAGCAAIGHGITQSVAISSEPYHAAVIIDGRPRGVTPFVGSLSRRSRHVVRIELEGYQPFETTLSRQTSGWVVADLLLGLGAPVGLVVDLLTGAIFNLTPDQVTHELAKRTSSNARLTPNGIYVMLVQGADCGWARVGSLQR